MDVTVVGAGLGGLAAAVALHRSGHAVTVLERAAQLRETGAGIGIMPNGVLALDALGLGAAVRDRAAPLGAAGGIRDRHGHVLVGTDQASLEERIGAPLAVVSRTWLHGALVAALPEGAIRTGRAVTTLRQVGDVVETGENETADLVVVADGAHSRLRGALFPDHPGLRGSGEYAARAMVAVAPGELAPGELLDHRTGDRFGCMPMSDGSVYWYSSWRADAPQDPVARHRWLRDRRADWHPCAARLVDATAPADVHVVETVQLARPLPRLAVGRIALLGDAAHAMTPDLGQGACQAFEDAVALGALFAGHPSDVPAALARYDEVRGPRTAALQQQARRTNRLLTVHGPAARARDAGLRLIPQRLATRALEAQLRFAPPANVGV